MEKKRLALVCQHFYPEMVSTGMHMTELARRLRKCHDWEITVYCAQPALEEGEEEVPTEMMHQGIRIRRVPTVGDQRESLVSRLFLALTYLVSTIQVLIQDRSQYDGLLVTTNPPFVGVAGWFISKTIGKPYVQLVYDVYPDLAEQLGVIEKRGIVSRLWEFTTRLFLNEAAGTVVIGRDMVDLIRGKLQRKNYGSMHLIPNWSDETTVKPILRDENPFRREHDIGDQMLVQYAGRHGKTHNLEPLIEAATQLTDQPILFQFIGGGDKKEKLQLMARDRDLENVMFLPYQPMEKLDTVLAAADIAVVCLETRFTGVSVPSKTYGIMASGTPVLGFLDAESEIGRTIQENQCGLVLEDPSGDEVVETLANLMDDSNLLEEMGNQGRQAFEEKFTLSTAAKRYDKVLSRYIYGERLGELEPSP